MKKMLAIIFVILFISCSTEDHKVEINCVYHGAIILEKIDFRREGFGDVCYHIKYKGEVIQYVNVFTTDADYEVGDTVNKPCLTDLAK